MKVKLNKCECGEKPTLDYYNFGTRPEYYIECICGWVLRYGTKKEIVTKWNSVMKKDIGT